MNTYNLRMRYHRKMPDVLNVALIGTKWWCKVVSTWWEFIVVIVHHRLAVEDAQKTIDEASVTLVCHTSSIIALSCQICQCIPRWIFVVVNKYLQVKPSQICHLFPQWTGLTGHSIFLQINLQNLNLRTVKDNIMYMMYSINYERGDIRRANERKIMN